MNAFSEVKLADEPGRIAALRRYEILDTPPEREFDEIVDLVRTVFGVHSAAVTLIDTDRQWIKAANGFPSGVDIPREDSFCQYAIAQPHAMMVTDARSDPRFAQNPHVSGDPGIRCYMGAPLRTPDGYSVGSVCIFDTVPRAFSAAEALMLESFGRLVMSQLELRQAARRDLLTGALSRRAFEDAMGAAVARSTDHPVSLLLFDIDHFKAVNDRFGHPGGDEALRSVAAAVRGTLRPRDLLGRVGGEEFAVLLPGAAGPDAATAAERLRQAVADTPVPALAGRPVTVSTGVAQLVDGEETREHWFGRADRALYLAKNAGRNCVRIDDGNDDGTDESTDAGPDAAGTAPG